jgi:hypothetical protein
VTVPSKQANHEIWCQRFEGVPASIGLDHIVCHW